MLILEPDAGERRQGHWREASLQRAVQAIADDGVVLLRAVADRKHCARLERQMLADIAEATAQGRIENDYQGVRPPPRHPWLFADIVHNDWAVQVTHRVLGDGLANVAYGSNAAYPGSTRQAVHGDGASLWPGSSHPPCSLVVNIPLTEVTEANGATAIWPGSHRCQEAAKPTLPSDEELARWERDHPGERACSQVGDILIRDVRMWHGGMPNTTDRTRIMIATIHHARWLIGGFQAETGSEDFFASHPLLRHRVEFVPAPMDHLLPHHSKASWLAGVGGPRARDEAKAGSYLMRRPAAAETPA